jgi:hypothetical protein
MKSVLPLLIAVAAAVAAPHAQAQYKVGDRLQESAKPGSAATYRVTKWGDLVPPDWKPMDALKDLNLGLLQDGDPRAMQALRRLREEWDKAPANETLNGTAIRIPGFVVPLESNDGKLREFLLVPYFGACIHTPPPPANQIIHIVASKPLAHTKAMDAVWVNGVLEIARSETMMGNAGYRMKAVNVEAYKEKD